MSTIKESPKRLDAGIKAAEAMGGKVHGWYLTMGAYDSAFIAEFPSDEICAKYMLSGRAGQCNYANFEGIYRRRVP